MPSPHHLHWNDRDFWTWCALDAIGIPAAMGGHAALAACPGGHGLPFDV